MLVYKFFCQVPYNIEKINKNKYSKLPKYAKIGFQKPIFAYFGNLSPNLATLGVNEECILQPNLTSTLLNIWNNYSQPCRFII